MCTHASQSLKWQAKNSKLRGKTQTTKQINKQMNKKETRTKNNKDLDFFFQNVTLETGRMAGKEGKKKSKLPFTFPDDLIPLRSARKRRKTTTH